MTRAPFWAAAAATLVLAAPRSTFAHCDALDGPVVQDARTALEKGDAAPALKWVPPAAEVEVRQAFTEAVAVRKLGLPAQALADRYFFETVVRLHREGEGEAYTGLKPAGGRWTPRSAAPTRRCSASAWTRCAG